MKRIISSAILCVFSLASLFAQVNAEDFLQIVSMESEQGTQTVFTSAGMGISKEEAEVNAVKSLFYTLMFQGVDGVNGNKPLVVADNKVYTNSFFNRQARYNVYVVGSERVGKFEKVGDSFQVTMKITIRLRQLVSDVQKNTKPADKVTTVTPPEGPGGTANIAAKPTIIVVPYKKDGESYKAILENDFDKRIAVSEVKKEFENLGIKTIDLQGRLDATNRGMQYDDNIGTAESNDKQMLLSSGADVYVIVDLKKDVSAEGSRVALIMEARETASGTMWASENGWTKRYPTSATDQLCAFAVKDNLPPFLAQIEKNYANPINAVLRVAVDGTSAITLFDECDNGERIIDAIQDWLDRNAHQGDYHLQGEMAESAIFDYVIIPRQDKNGYKMTTSKFARELRKHLISLGVQLDGATGVRIEGNTIMLTIM
ncbi:MAG: hypothetical protein IKT86_07310 [Bacteroidaceae bacterium]|nr:hypothetical protein [Bacteroidaceae bacterium]